MTPHALYAETTGGDLEVIFGAPPSQDLRAAAAALRDKAGLKPQVREFGEHLLVRVSVTRGGAHLWLIQRTDADRLSLAKHFAGASAALLRPGAAVQRTIHSSATDQVTALTQALAAMPYRRRRTWLRQALTLTSQITGWRNPALIELQAGRIKQVLTSDPNASQQAELLAALVLQMRARQCSWIDSQDNAQNLDTNLFCSTFGVERFAITVPDERDGFALYAEGSIGQSDAEAVRRLLSIRTRPAAPWIPDSHRRRIFSSAALLLALFLIWPVHLQIGGPGSLLPAESEVLVAPQGGRLVEVLAQVGDSVEAGQIIARLISPELLEAQRQADLDRLLEELAASEMLGEGNYAKYRLAQQRGEIAATIEAQARRRVQELEVKATQAGRIADVVPLAERGLVKPVGAFIAEVQVGERMHATLSLGSSDAAFVKAGMEGSLAVRGLVGRPFSIRVLADPIARTREDGEIEMRVQAELNASPGDLSQASLVKGLSVYAHIQSERRPRILNWLRPLTEYLRFQLWKYLGLPL